MVMVRFDRCGWGREEMEDALVNCAELSHGSELRWRACVLSSRKSSVLSICR